ncbi:MAG: YeeE/YedE family protein [Hyphomicrobiales bacterium]
MIPTQIVFPAIGGAMIGLASIMLLALLGRVMGVSSIYSRLLAWRGSPVWRLAFILGLLAGPLLFLAFGRPVQVQVAASLPLLAIAGLLVGLGTGLGNGCTSGHGICGISRLSPRSIVATVTFVAVGMATATALRHFAGV